MVNPTFGEIPAQSETNIEVFFRPSTSTTAEAIFEF